MKTQYRAVVIVLDLISIPFLTLPEKLILSFEFEIFDNDITSYKLQKVIKDAIS